MESGKWERISPDFPPALHSHPGPPQRPQEPFETLQGSNFWIAFPPHPPPVEAGHKARFSCAQEVAVLPLQGDTWVYFSRNAN